MRANKIAAVTTTALLLIGSFSAQAAPEKIIKISTWGSPNHGINKVVWPTWGAWIEEATDGRVGIKIEYDLAPPHTQIDVVTDGIGDATWIFHGHKAGRFQLTQLPEIPTFSEGSSSELMSQAYWRTYSKYLKDGREHRGVEVLALSVHGPGQLITKNPVESLDALQGKKIRVGGGVISSVAKDMKVTPVFIPTTKVYESISQGVVEGAYQPVEALSSFRLAEVADNTLVIPGGLYRGSFAIVMNQDTLRSLSKEDQQSIKDVSGEQLSRLFGKMWDDVDNAAYETALEGGHTFTPATEEMITELKKSSEPLVTTWHKAAQKRKVDGPAAYAYFHQQLEQGL
ncbi:TRAP transporter substrate-binding protein [Vibrio superstes]|uniref:ABC transporter substrate-binding protein n=1 Tax=Vibrio superstes NBRC 103154 TaxID=1219062 RepID=A0A511QQR5_9VIBR|nr:TRAP transporter substrate-binding protein [Vibrio superstes]GEM79684.1 ABC transporter substrate-binding protein [Vibrio superstes NBRC 103154]